MQTWKPFCEKQKSGKLVLDLKEALYLLENKKVEIGFEEKKLCEKKLLKYASPLKIRSRQAFSRTAQKLSKKLVF